VWINDEDAKIQLACFQFQLINVEDEPFDPENPVFILEGNRQSLAIQSQSKIHCYRFLIYRSLATSRDDFNDLECCLSSSQIESTWNRSVRNPWISEYQNHKRFQRATYPFFQKSLLFC
jgi:hypothetical protein